MVRAGSPPDRIVFSRRCGRNLVLHSRCVLLETRGTSDARQGTRNRLEYPVHALLDAVPHLARLVDEQTIDFTLW